MLSSYEKLRTQVVSKITDVDEYIEIALVFLEYLLVHFTEKEVNIFLKDVVKHVKKDTSSEAQQVLLCR